MAYREFRDRQGVEWHVWDVGAQSAGAGWLAFESKFEKRRLRPIPPGWTGQPDDALERMLGDASPAPPPRRLIG